MNLLEKYSLAWNTLLFLHKKANDVVFLVLTNFKIIGEITRSWTLALESHFFFLDEKIRQNSFKMTFKCQQKWVFMQIIFIFNSQIRSEHGLDSGHYHRFKLANFGKNIEYMKMNELFAFVSNRMCVFDFHVWLIDLLTANQFGCNAIKNVDFIILIKLRFILIGITFLISYHEFLQKFGKFRCVWRWQGLSKDILNQSTKNDWHFTDISCMYTKSYLYI